MRYAILTDVHANLEALEAVLARIDEIAKEKPINQIWFLGDLVGYGPDPNECIRVLRQRTDVIIAGNHDWAAVGKIDLEDFSAAARISAEWTAEQLTAEHRDFLINLPERLEIGECTLVHGSPYGPLWEYLTSQALAERSFQHFDTRYCLVGHTHVPLIFIQPDAASIPTLPLADNTQVTNAPNGAKPQEDSENVAVNNHHERTRDSEGGESAAATPVLKPGDTPGDTDDDETVELITVPDQQSTLSAEIGAESAARAHQETHSSAPPAIDEAVSTGTGGEDEDEGDSTEIAISTSSADKTNEFDDDPGGEDEAEDAGEASDDDSDEDLEDTEGAEGAEDLAGETHRRTPQNEISNAEERLTNEIEELLNLLGLSQSMVEVTNEMLSPPEGHWEAPPDYRAIINPGGVGQPRDGDPRAAFMIYDTDSGFEFYRVSYDFEQTQDKIISAGLPQFLAMRLSYGR